MSGRPFAFSNVIGGLVGDVKLLDTKGQPSITFENANRFSPIYPEQSRARNICNFVSGRPRVCAPKTSKSSQSANPSQHTSQQRLTGTLDLILKTTVGAERQDEACEMLVSFF